jgi:hypothetical protein
MSATTSVGNHRPYRWPQLPFFRRKDEERGLCGSADQVACQRVKTRSYPINRAKARTLNSAFQIADEGAIEACLQVEFHLREPKLLSHGPHYFTKRPFHASTGLNLFSTLGHLHTHRAPLSAVGQRVVTDKLEENNLPEAR